MKTIVNKTSGPLRVPLPHSKVLHLGPKQTGHVSVHDAGHPPLKKMVEDGQLEIWDGSGNEAIPQAGRGRQPFEH